MSLPEDFADRLRAEITVLRIKADVLDYARQNIEPIGQCAEKDIVALFSAYDLIYCVWPHTHGGVGYRKIKGPDCCRWDDTLRINAIPVRDESEARRWAALLSPMDQQPADDAPRIRLATSNGEPV